LYHQGAWGIQEKVEVTATAEVAEDAEEPVVRKGIPEGIGVSAGPEWHRIRGQTFLRRDEIAFLTIRI